MAALIEVKLAELAQLFNSMDPAPFRERDLDHHAEEFIVSWAQEHAHHEELKLVIHLAKSSAASLEQVQAVQESVQHYFTYQAEMLWREFRLLMREGRMALLVGLAFLALCQAIILFFVPAYSGEWKALSESMNPAWIGKLRSFLREGLTIAGWVAMWKPLEIYLYRWWPLLAKRRLYARLAQMTVEVRPLENSLEKPAATDVHPLS
ncbi:MAG: hypothetical protein OJI67_15900 [Prosthecobacter sp.]|nr:hypothetical protein [Prosthecobacter sp.]